MRLRFQLAAGEVGDVVEFCGAGDGGGGGGFELVGVGERATGAVECIEAGGDDLEAVGAVSTEGTLSSEVGELKVFGALPSAAGVDVKVVESLFVLFEVGFALAAEEEVGGGLAGEGIEEFRETIAVDVGKACSIEFEERHVSVCANGAPWFLGIFRKADVSPGRSAGMSIGADATEEEHEAFGAVEVLIVEVSGGTAVGSEVKLWPESTDFCAVDGGPVVGVADRGDEETAWRIHIKRGFELGDTGFELSDFVGDFGDLSVAAGAGDGGKDESGEDTEDDDHHEQFDEGEAAAVGGIICSSCGMASHWGCSGGEREEGVRNEGRGMRNEERGTRNKEQGARGEGRGARGEEGGSGFASQLLTTENLKPKTENPHLMTGH